MEKSMYQNIHMGFSKSNFWRETTGIWCVDISKEMWKKINSLSFCACKSFMFQSYWCSSLWTSKALLTLERHFALQLCWLCFAFLGNTGERLQLRAGTRQRKLILLCTLYFLTCLMFTWPVHTVRTTPNEKKIVLKWNSGDAFRWENWDYSSLLWNMLLYSGIIWESCLKNLLLLQRPRTLDGGWTCLWIPVILSCVLAANFDLSAGAWS